MFGDFRLRFGRVLLGLAAWATAASAWAFYPPVETAGPLTVRIQGPEVITQQETPQAVQVIIENRGDAPVQGTLRVWGIDRWQIDPAGTRAFAVPARGKSTTQFHVSAARGSYSAHYPIHALARFSVGAESFAAHPILIVPTKFADPPPALMSLPWKPIELSNPGELDLVSTPVRRAIVQVFGEKPLVMPVSWEGTEPRSRASFSHRAPAADGSQRPAVGMHPPWYDRHVGTIALEFPLRLPATKPLRLRFANAMQPAKGGDGVTFRVRVAPIDAADGELGRIVFERHTKSTAGEPAEVNLDALAGQTIRLQLESHPGPKHDTSFDQSFWESPVLIVGTPPTALPFPPEDVAGTRTLGTATCGGTSYQVHLRPGRRGLLDAAVGFSSGTTRLWFRGFEIRVLGAALQDPGSPIVLREAVEEPGTQGYQVRHRFAGPTATFDLVGQLWIEQGVLRVKFHLENGPPPQPWHVVYLEDVAPGPWNHVLRQVYAGDGNVLREPKEFRLDFDGHRLSTSFVGLDFIDGPSLVMGTDQPPSRLEVRPRDRLYALRAAHGATFSFIPAPSVWEGAKTWRDVNGLKAAGGVATAAGRFVFDLWHGDYAASTDQLHRAFRYGLTDAMVVWHNWQRWGYDYRLPEIFPPNPKLGTLAQMQDLARECTAAGVVFAPHDNYIDFYPDAEGFSYDERITFNAPGRPRRAWLNEGTQAQSYQYRADQIEQFLRSNVELIRKYLSPTGYFIDVWSSAPPYDYWTVDGRFFSRLFTRDVWRRQFAWIREFLGGKAPQISESGHDQLIGWLDGAQTNHLRVGKPGPGKRGWTVWNLACADAERIPWFDAAHHDRFVLHGAGYPGRYEGGLDPREHGIYSDDYMATEVLTGHPAMVSQAFCHDAVRKYWLLHELGRALALRTLDHVEFAADDLHRQHVTWSGGGEVWVNRGPSDWTVAGVTLPQYGFVARVPTAHGPVESSIVRRDGLIVETAHAADEWYVNGRKPAANGPQRIQFTVESVRHLGGRQFQLTLKWQADDAIPAGWLPFLHCVDEQGEILFQPSHRPGAFTSPRQGAFSGVAEGRFPDGLAVGRAVELRFGLYRHGVGERMLLAGADDGTRRIRLGTLRLEGPAEKPTGVAWTPAPIEPDPLLARINPLGRPVDFGPIITADGCRLSRTATGLVLTPLPQSAGERFSARLRWSLLPWSLPKPTHVELVGEDGKVLERRAVQRENDQITIESPAEVFAVRLMRP